MKLEILDKAAKFVGDLTLKTKVNSPQILIGVGVVGVVATAVAASRATLKLEPTIDDALGHKENLDSIEFENARAKGREYLYFYSHTAFKIVKIYAPAVAIGGFTIGCIVGGHKVLSKRNALITASYAALETAFKDYRSVVADVLGEEGERDIREKAYHLNRDREEVVETEGEETKVLTTKDVDPYLRLFDEYNENWTKNAQENLFFVKNAERYANDRLQRIGHVFLNEVLDSMGFPRTAAGAVTGWYKDNPEGDGYVDFGLYKSSNKDFIEGRERSVWLEFNVDGVIYDKL